MKRRVAQSPPFYFFTQVESLGLFSLSYLDHAAHRRTQLLRVANARTDDGAEILSVNAHAAKIPVILRRWWSPGGAGCGDCDRELNCVHAATCQLVVRITHKPATIATILDEVG
jgi:hypothetical protein